MTRPDEALEAVAAIRRALASTVDYLSEMDTELRRVEAGLTKDQLGLRVLGGNPRARSQHKPPSLTLVEGESS